MLHGQGHYRAEREIEAARAYAASLVEHEAPPATGNLETLRVLNREYLGHLKAYTGRKSELHGIENTLGYLKATALGPLKPKAHNSGSVARRSNLTSTRRTPPSSERTRSTTRSLGRSKRKRTSRTSYWSSTPRSANSAPWGSCSAGSRGAGPARHGTHTSGHNTCSLDTTKSGFEVGLGRSYSWVSGKSDSRKPVFMMLHVSALRRQQLSF
jgi:hypothetical protein